MNSSPIRGEVVAGGLFEIRRADAGDFALIHVASGVTIAARPETFKMRALAKTYGGWPEFADPALRRIDGEVEGAYLMRTAALWLVLAGRERERQERRKSAGKRRASGESP